ncbi:cyclin-Y-like protein 2 [Sapajus apella]|uniref:Cyclin-Y-like protein 2 n=1 Tax=Sapajus apella TaxID=9515 RepID=A0A6J3GAP9_SAPAP|nr:cyclin-Y-like protein 2 [Sapajus apella]
MDTNVNTAVLRALQVFSSMDTYMHPFFFQQGEVVEEYFKYDPTHKVILRFLRTLCKAKKLNAYLTIISLVYVRRLLECADINICPTNWRRIVFGAILLVVKVGSNVAQCNENLCKLFEKITVDDMDELQRDFLELINYDFSVSRGMYTSHYFYLRELAFNHGLSLPSSLLDRQRAWDLKALSRMDQDEAFYTAHETGSLSADDLIRLQHAKAVLS